MHINTEAELVDGAVSSRRPTGIADLGATGVERFDRAGKQKNTMKGDRNAASPASGAQNEIPSCPWPSRSPVVCLFQQACRVPSGEKKGGRAELGTLTSVVRNGPIT